MRTERRRRDYGEDTNGVTTQDEQQHIHSPTVRVLDEAEDEPAHGNEEVGATAARGTYTQRRKPRRRGVPRTKLVRGAVALTAASPSTATLWRAGRHHCGGHRLHPLASHNGTDRHPPMRMPTCALSLCA